MSAAVGVSERSGRGDGVVPGRRSDGVWEHPYAIAATQYTRSRHIDIDTIAATPRARRTGRRPCRYVNESMTAANEIKLVVEKMKENLSKAENILDTWSVQPLLKRSGKAQPVDDFEQLQKVTLKERYDVIRKGGAYLGVLRCCGAFTSLDGLVSIRRGRGSFLRRI